MRIYNIHSNENAFQGVIAVEPLSDKLSLKTILRICDYLNEDYFLNAFQIKAIPVFGTRQFLKIRPWLKEKGFEIIEDTLDIVEKDTKNTIDRIKKNFYESLEYIAKEKNELNITYFHLPVENRNVIKVYLCPIRMGEKNMFSNIFTYGVKEDCIFVFLKMKNNRNKKEFDEWCIMIAGEVIRLIAYFYGMNSYMPLINTEYKSKNVEELESLVINAFRQKIPTIKRTITEDAVIKYFERKGFPLDCEDCYIKMELNLDDLGIDVLRFGGSSGFDTIVAQVETELNFSKMKKFNENVENILIKYLYGEARKQLICSKYYVTKKFDKNSIEYAKRNNIQLITFDEIIKEVPELATCFKEAGII